MNADLLEDFLRASPESQQRYIASLRELEATKIQLDAAEERYKLSLEERWLRVARWRRATILLAQWVQVKFTPKWL